MTNFAGAELGAGGLTDRSLDEVIPVFPRCYALNARYKTVSRICSQDASLSQARCSLSRAVSSPATGGGGMAAGSERSMSSTTLAARHSP